MVLLLDYMHANVHVCVWVCVIAEAKECLQYVPLCSH